jgi:hypothetical protein
MLPCVLHVLSSSFVWSQLPGKLATGALSLHLKRPKCECGHSPASVKTARIFTSSQKYAFIAVFVHRQLYRLPSLPPLSPVQLTQCRETTKYSAEEPVESRFVRFVTPKYGLDPGPESYRHRLTSWGISCTLVHLCRNCTVASKKNWKATSLPVPRTLLKLASTSDLRSSRILSGVVW